MVGLVRFIKVSASTRLSLLFITNYIRALRLRKAKELLTINSGRSVPEVARTMGLGENLVYKWKAESRIQENPEEKSVNSELDQLRKQIRQLETERDILKKRSLFLAGGHNKMLRSNRSIVA